MPQSGVYHARLTSGDVSSTMVDVVPRKPTKPNPNARIQVAMRLHPDSVAKLDAMAEAEDRTRSDMARILLKEAFEARERKAKLGR